jgi:hypothetical protein
MSDVQPAPSPSPEASPQPSTKPEENKGFWGHVADVADFLFATKSLGRVLTGESGWGDLANLGITAASFFIPPLRLLKFGAKPLESIIAHAAEVAASDTASAAAKSAAERTAENARYLLENPEKHEQLAHIASDPSNSEIPKLNNLHEEADHLLEHGTVPEPPVRRVGELSKDEIEPSIANEMDRFKTEPKEIVVKTDRTIATPKGVAERFGKVSGSGDETKNVTRGLLEEENAPKDLLKSSVVEKDRADYPFLTQEDIAQYRADGRSEEYIANMNRLEESLGGSKTTEPRNVNPYAEKYPHVHPDVVAKILTGEIDETGKLIVSSIAEKKLKALNEAGKRAGYTAPTEVKTTEALTAAEQNKLNTVNAEFPVTADGKPITRRMEDSMPEDMRTGNLKVDRTAWLLSESKKLENFLKKSPDNAGEIRVTKDLWNKQANELQLKMDPDERIQANQLADDLTKRNLADYQAGKDATKRGVVDFDVAKETDINKLTDARKQLIEDWRAETDPDLKKAIAFTGKKVSARIEQLNNPAVEGSVLTKIRPLNISHSDPSYNSLINNTMKDVIDKHIGETATLPPMSSKALKRFEELGLEPPSDVVPAIEEVVRNQAMDEVISSKEYKQVASKIDEHFGGTIDTVDPSKADLLREQTKALQDKIKIELLHTATLKELLRDPNKVAELKNIENQLNEIRNAKICLAINGQDLVKVFKDGIFRTQFETNTSGGYLNHQMRSDVEAIQHDVWMDASPSERPVYGYLAKDESQIVHSNVDPYGHYRIVFKPHVRSRATFTNGDSLGNFNRLISYLPVPLEGELKPNQIFQALTTHDLKNVFKNVSVINDVNYSEAQIFGPLKIEDIESVYFTTPPEKWMANELDQLKEIFKTHNIQFNMHGNVPGSTTASTLDG